MAYEWDPAKDLANRDKHGLSFDEAVEVFDDDDRALELYDERHSHEEERFITIAPTRSGLLVVAWTERSGDTIRIISARRATAREKAMYVNAMRHR